MLPEASRCGGGGAVDASALRLAADALDRASAAGCGEHSVDSPEKLHRLSGSGPDTFSHTGDRSQIFLPAQPGSAGGSGFDQQASTGFSVSLEHFDGSIWVREFWADGSHLNP